MLRIEKGGVEETLKKRGQVKRPLVLFKILLILNGIKNLNVYKNS